MSAVATDRYNALYAAGDFTPINRWGNPEDVGYAAAALASGRFGFSTGDSIHVDGGLHIPRI
jgi:NAD(P)-dependent dehydrogenase (short-subunit alcohol dehydrogenase family)